MSFVTQGWCLLLCRPSTTQYLFRCFCHHLVEFGGEVIQVSVQDAEGCKATAYLSLEDVRDGWVLQSLQVKLNPWACCLRFLLQPELQYQQYEVMVAADVGSWVGACSGLVDAGLEATRRQDEIHLIVD